MPCGCEIECHKANLTDIAKARNAPAILSKGKFKVVACKKCYKAHLDESLPVEIKNTVTWENFLSTGIPLIVINRVEAELAKA